MVPVCRQSTGPRPSVTQCTFIIDLYTTRQRKHHSKDTTVCAWIYLDSRYLVPVSASSGPAIARANSIIMIPWESSWDILPWTIMSTRLTSRWASSRPAITRSSMRLGTSRAQLLYDLGLEYQDDENEEIIKPTPTASPVIPVQWPPVKLFPISPTKWKPPPECYTAPLPLRKSALPQLRAPPVHQPRTAAAACVSTDTPPDDNPPESQQGPKISSTKLPHDFSGVVARTKATLASELVLEFVITKKNLAPIYMSPCPYFNAFKEEIDLRKFNLNKHKTAGLCLAHVDG
jgi:hypothetical protein